MISGDGMWKSEKCRKSQELRPRLIGDRGGKSSARVSVIVLKSHINPFRYSDSKWSYPQRYKLRVTAFMWYSSYTFDENLLEDIDCGSAADAGRGGDTPWPVQSVAMLVTYRAIARRQSGRAACKQVKN
jgi:hypothetical protein